MKKVLSSLVAAGVVGMAISSYAQPEPPVRLGFALPGSPTVDGVISEGEWDAAITHAMENPVLEGATLPETSDKSATWKALYDDEYLYVLVEVLDDVIVSNAESVNQDGVEVFIDGDYSRGVGTAWNLPGQDYTNDFQFGFAPTQLTGGSKAAILTGLYHSALWTQDAMLVDYEMSLNADGDGYFVEALFEMVGFNIEAVGNFDDDPIAPTVDEVTAENFDQYRHIGFEVHATEDDTGTARELKLAWANSQDLWPDAPTAGGDLAWYQPVSFGTLVFVEGGIITECTLDWNPLVAVNDGWVATDAAGWIYVYNEDWGYSLHLGAIYTENCALIYQTNFGWMYRVAGDASAQWFYSLDYGWIYVSASSGGWFQWSTDGTTWSWNNFLNPQQAS